LATEGDGAGEAGGVGVDVKSGQTIGVGVGDRVGVADATTPAACDSGEFAEAATKKAKTKIATAVAAITVRSIGSNPSLGLSPSMLPRTARRNTGRCHRPESGLRPVD
jgi:hypothetical protein